MSTEDPFSEHPHSCDQAMSSSENEEAAFDQEKAFLGFESQEDEGLPGGSEPEPEQALEKGIREVPSRKSRGVRKTQTRGAGARKTRQFVDALRGSMNDALPPPSPTQEDSPQGAQQRLPVLPSGKGPWKSEYWPCRYMYYCGSRQICLGCEPDLVTQLKIAAD